MTQENKFGIPGAKEVKNSNIPFMGLIIAVVIINLIIIALILLLKNILPPQVPIFYGLAEGEDQLGPFWALIIPSLVALGILLLNILFSMFINNNFLRKVLVIAGLMVTFLSLITVVKIVFLIGSF